MSASTICTRGVLVSFILALRDQLLLQQVCRRDLPVDFKEFGNIDILSLPTNMCCVK